MTKKTFFTFLLLFSFFLCSFWYESLAQGAPGGASGSSMTPPVPNKLKIASVSTTCLRKSESQQYQLDLSKVPAGYQNEIKFYTVNGLRSLGLQEVPTSDFVIAAELHDTHLNVVSANPRRERKTVSYQLIATEKGQQLWTAKSSCAGRASEASNYWFPGLVASILPYYGESKHARLAINKYPAYLSAVNTVITE